MAKRYCEYNGCSDCYSEHVSEELDQVCKKHYKNLDYVWRTYECFVHTPLVYNVSWLIRSVGRYCKSKERMLFFNYWNNKIREKVIVCTFSFH